MSEKLQTVYVDIDKLTKADYNPRKWDEKALSDLKASIQRFGLVDPIILNGAENRMNVVIGGHMRLEAAKALGIKQVPAVYINLPDIEKEKELNLRLNKNQGEFDFALLANFAEEFLSDIGFNSEELDSIFDLEIDNPEIFDLQKELDKLDIKKVEIQKGDIWQLGDNRLMCGDSTIEENTLKLMDGHKADMCFTDPPYILDYLKGKKKNGKPVEGFGAKRNRKYLETDVLPDNFTELWMGNIAKIASDNFHIIVYENWKNLRVIWNEMEMRQQAKREKLFIVEEITESHSAKETGQRPQFNYMIDNLHQEKYSAIVTWAPDRISRNAGDLGRIVDLMDQGKLLFIQTHTQMFSNNPNKKFLLMILGSQAKLENDNRGINVKRGHRNKCKMVIRPGPAPIGYINIMKNNRIASVELDPEKAPIIKEIFMKVANQGYSGRMIKKWLDKQKFRTRNNKAMVLGRIYATLNNPFYYGEFKYGRQWYKGDYEPLITKYIFDKVQIQLEVVPRQWNKQIFPFKKIARCGSCGGSVTAEVKYRRTKKGIINTHIYYHCNRIRDYDCKEPYITEKELIKQLIASLPKIKIDSEFLWQGFEDEIKRLNHLRGIMNQQAEEIRLTPHNTQKTKAEITETETQMLREYLLHILQFGTPEERKKILGGIKSKFELSDRKLILK